MAYEFESENNEAFVQDTPTQSSNQTSIWRSCSIMMRNPIFVMVVTAKTFLTFFDSGVTFWLPIYITSVFG